MEIVTMYEQLGVSRAVYEYGEAVLRDLRPRFDVIDQTAEYNQGKVLAAMQKNRVNATHFAATTGYGYNDDGRDNLERVYADVFHTEAALVRPQITCGTHALAVALSANLLPGDELLSPVGAPYDTLEEVIGIRESKCSLKEYGVTYAQADLKPDGTFDYDAIREKINGRTKLITIQRSKGYATRPSFSVRQIGELIAFCKGIKPDVKIMVDNCYAFPISFTLNSSFTLSKSLPLKNLLAKAYKIDSISLLYGLVISLLNFIAFNIFSLLSIFPPITGVNVSFIISCLSISFPLDSLSIISSKTLSPSSLTIDIAFTL